LKRAVLIVLIVIAVLGAALPFAPVDFMKGPMERALSRGLGRKVEIDSVSLTLFSGPGFSLGGVTIHEDPRAGIEPFAYATTLDATLKVFPLLGGQLEFSSLHFNDATLNLVKPNEETWNFQMLLATSPAIRLPSLKVRGGRINFKFGDTKSVVFFDDTDLDVLSRESGAVELRFSGAPARTDRSLQGFGHFFVRGASAPNGQLSFRVELEPSSLDSVARLFSTNVPDLKGAASLDAQVSGLPQHLDVKGVAQFGEGGKLRLDYKGVLDLVGHTLELASVLPPELHTSLRLSASNLLATPQWDVSAEMNSMPLDALMNIARQVGAPVPAGQGTVSGNPGYSSAAGFSGNVEIQDAVVPLLKTAAMTIPTATVFLKKNTIIVGPVTVNFADKDTAEGQATYQSGEGGGTEWKVSTRRMSIANTRALGLMNAPLLDRVTGGVWRGVLKYQQPASGAGAWSGDFDVLNAQVKIDGLATPVDVQAATVSAKPARVTLSRMKAKAGEIAFFGDYSWDLDIAEPHQFRLQAARVDLKEVERLFAPTLARSGGVLSRTLGLGSAPAAPEWLTNRKAQGTVAFDGLTVGEVIFAGTTRLSWTGTGITLAATNAKIADAIAAGELHVDLSAAAPRYQYTGAVKMVRYKGGTLDFDGKAEAEGSGAALLASLKAEGSLQGRAISVPPPGGDYRRVRGRFAVRMTPAGPQWNASDLEVQQGADTLTGEAISEADGKLVVKLNRMP
jgi:AsmA-like protein